jgi:hypothetical protein
MDLDLARERGLWPLHPQGPPGPAVVKDHDNNQSRATEPDTD